MPEGVLAGYSKLLLLDELALGSLLSKDEIKDLEGARKVAEDNKLDLSLIRSGLLMLYPYICLSEEQEKKRVEFQKYIEGLTSENSSEEVFVRCLKESSIPILKVFTNGHDMQDVFGMMDEMRKVKKPEKAEKPEQPDMTEEENERKPEKEREEVIQEEEKEVEIRSLDEIIEKYQKINTDILNVVKGQEAAVKKFIEGCFQGELFKQTERNNRPRSTFFFFGPPGTGKTLLAETAAAAFGIPFEKYDMSDYNTNISNIELIGSSDSIGRGSKGKLTSFVEKNPECILLFDEIEKASIEVIRMFLSILGSGAIRDKKTDRLVSFKDAIIIFTSNVGSELYKDRNVNLSTIPERILTNAIRNEKDDRGHQVLPNEIISRLEAGNTILFNHLGVRTLADMVNEGIEKNVISMEKEYGCQITYSPQFALLLLFSRGSEMDARVATSKSNAFIRSEIYELSRQLENLKDKSHNLQTIDFDIDYSGMDEDLKRLFKNDEKTELLVFGDKDLKEFFDKKSDTYTVHYATTVSEMKKLLERDITAIFIDPFHGKRSDNDTILSIADYNTDGVRMFHELVETSSGMPIYVMDRDDRFSEVDRRTFLQEGAANIFKIDKDNHESGLRLLDQLMEELYMERESHEFSQRGQVIDFKSRQENCGDGRIRVVMYDLKKKLALDSDDRESVLSDAERPSIRFNDVIGAENAKESLKYYIDYLKNPKKFLLNGGKMPRGILLYGPPGTGKTMLAKALAGESDVTFIETSAAEFKNKYVGESEANIRRIFSNARRHAPAIIFIDEIDAIGKKRTGSEFTHVEEGMLNTLLTEMDGFKSVDPKHPVFVLAATNFGVKSEKTGVSGLDPALIRRFDQQIYVDLPNEQERTEYMTLILKKSGISEVSEDTIKNIAERTTGNSLAELENILEAAKLEGRKNGKITDEHLLQALEEYIYGEKKETTPEYYRSVAVHETGHAIVSYLAGDKPTYLTIESRGSHGGYMQHANKEKKFSYTREELLGMIRTALAGRAAETVFYGKEKANNTGASSDLTHATDLAFEIMLSLGMEENQLIVLNKDEIMKSNLSAQYIQKVNELLNEEMKNAMKIIEDNKELVKTLADELVAKNHLSGVEFENLVKKVMDKN